MNNLKTRKVYIYKKISHIRADKKVCKNTIKN